MLSNFLGVDEVLVIAGDPFEATKYKAFMFEALRHRSHTINSSLDADAHTLA